MQQMTRRNRTGIPENQALMQAPLNFQPGAECADTARKFQGIPGIARAPQGRLWATWYGGGTGEDRFNYIMLATSDDDGATWSDVQLVIDPDGDGPVRAFDPCLWLDPDNRLWLFWAQQVAAETPPPAQVWAISTSDPDNARPPWSPPRHIHPGIMMNKPIVRSDGAWLLPVSLWFRDRSAMVVASFDRGGSFERLGAATIPEHEDRIFDEHMLVERRDGSLWMLVRTRYGIGTSTSADGGKTWSDVRRGDMEHPSSRFFIRRLRSGDLLLVKHGPRYERTSRCRLTATLSSDDGDTWTGGLLLDERERISYPDGVQNPDGSIHVIYDFDRYGQKDILMATFTEADVQAGHGVSDVFRMRHLVNRATGVNETVQNR